MERGVYVHYLLPRFLAEVLPNLVEYEFQEELRNFLEEVSVVMKLRWKAREIEIPNFIQSKITQFLKNKQEKIKDNKVMKIDRKLKLRVMDLVFKWKKNYIFSNMYPLGLATFNIQNYALRAWHDNYVQNQL